MIREELIMLMLYIEKTDKERASIKRRQNDGLVGKSGLEQESLEGKEYRLTAALNAVKEKTGIYALSRTESPSISVFPETSRETMREFCR